MAKDWNAHSVPASDGFNRLSVGVHRTREFVDI